MEAANPTTIPEDVTAGAGGAAAGPADSDPVPGMADLGVIGNLHTAALVSRFGAIEWACFPRFASPSVFGRILDRTRGGFHRIAPVEPATSVQRYLPSTAALETTFELSGGRKVVLVDFMPILGPPLGDSAPIVVRTIEVRGGPVALRAETVPGFDYARQPCAWERRTADWLAQSTAGALGVVPGWEMEARGGRLAGARVLADGGRASFELYWGTDRPTADGATDLLRRTEAFWTAWVHPADSPIHQLAGRWHPWIERSEITIKLLSNAETGAFVAAPTTSLPEWPGGSRNWDYRYVWIRDAAFAAQALLMLGHTFEARGFLRWILGVVRAIPPGEGLRVVYGAHPDADLAEYELDHLAGYRDSRPVRVGNGAAQQFQLDIYGELLDAALLLAEIEPDALVEPWPDLERLADEVVATWRQPDQGIWEIRGPPAHFVYSKVMAWVALDRAISLGRRYGTPAATARWEKEAAAIRELVLTDGYDAQRETFRQAVGRDAIDAANLRLPIVGFLPPDDPRVAGTVLRIERELTHGPFVYRYRAPDGFPEPEGSFLPCSFWLVDCLARAGERGRALRNFDRLLEAATPLRLFAEEYDPQRDLALGNFPQAFTHIALLRSAVSLGLSRAGPEAYRAYPWLERGVPAEALPARGAAPGSPDPRPVGPR
ncbi:MAG TPA: glycoside hydrolase family 15 protein [Thermoplasmata archaeon]|nr:glycoside hydrolase family 15 protein [Thermoplasmata archaeon]